MSVASFRDSQLIPTIHSLLENADHPENLKICIAWQRGDEDFEKGQLDEYKDDPRFIILDIPYLESKGACSSRNLIQQKYSDEDWYLQIDSHMRFVPHWDTTSIRMISWIKRNKGSKKPLLTAYVPSFDPFNDPAGRSSEIWKLNWDRFIPESPFFVLPASMTEEEKQEPLLCRFFSGHFVFVQGSFVKEVPYDPNLYFHGEEGSLAVRAWTSGYDLYNPNVLICLHEYGREYRKGLKVWDTNSDWSTLNTASHLRHRKLFEMDGETREGIDFGPYDFGKERTLAEYEKFAGIQFKTRGVQRWTLDHQKPPNPNDHWESEEAYQNSFEKIFRHCLDLWKESLTEPDYLFFGIFFHDKEGNEMYRQDANEEEVRNILASTPPDKQWINIWRQFHTEKKPYSWTVWPYTKSKGWMDKIEGRLS